MKKNLTLDKYNNCNIKTRLKIDNYGKEAGLSNLKELSKMPT